MSQYFIDKLVYNNDTLDIHDTEAREMINANTTNIQAVSARVTKNANDINTLKDTTDVIRVDLDNVEDRVSVTEAEIDGLTTRTTSLEGKMVTVENRLDGHDTKISGLEGRMDTAENNITALDGRMTTAENDIDAAEHRLDLVEAKNSEQDTAIDNLEVNVAKNTADIVDIKADLTGIHTDINDLDDRITASTYEAGIGIYFGQGAEHTNINVDDEILNQINQNTIDIQNLKTRVTNVENRLTVVEGDITNIKGDITDIKGDITDIKGDIVNIKAEIVNIKADIVTIKGDITNIKADIVTIKADITSLETRVTNLETTVNLLEDESIYKYYDSSNISEFPISEYTSPVIDRKFVINEVPAGSWGYASALVPFTTADRWECWIECYKRPGATMTSSPVSRIRYARVSAVTHPSPYMSNHINMLFRKIDTGTWEVVEGELYLGLVKVPSTSGGNIGYIPPSAAEIAFNTAFHSANNIQEKSRVNTRVDVKTSFNNNETIWNVLHGSGNTLMGFAAYNENSVRRNCCVAVAYNWDTPTNTYVSVTDI